ncbi:MAG: hypothetical protein IJM33_08395 [Bacteroidales bacterium]|nr:hypothetical protein [Bacteroidales bacterium]
MFRHRSFWIILVITAIVWLVATMSEHGDYPLEIRVEWQGYDTTRYVVTHQDTLLPVTINSNCFLAIGRYRAAKRQPFTIVTSGDTVVKVNDVLFGDIKRQFGFHSIYGFKSSMDALSITLEERQRRPFVPQLRNVDFEFAEQCGLSGNPVLMPDTVWLYGAKKHLEQIQAVYTHEARFSQISDSCYRMLALEPVWQGYPDVHPSVDSVRLFLPVDRYVEKTLTVPVRFQNAGIQSEVRLYPERVDVTLWVPFGHYDEISADQVHVSVDFSSAKGDKELPVMATLFPSNTRVKQISPSAIQYVIIQ